MKSGDLPQWALSQYEMGNQYDIYDTTACSSNLSFLISYLAGSIKVLNNTVTFMLCFFIGIALKIPMMPFWFGEMLVASSTHCISIQQILHCSRDHPPQLRTSKVKKIFVKINPYIMRETRNILIFLLHDKLMFSKLMKM